MAATFNLEIATPERNFYKDSIDMVIVDTPEGEMGVLSGHEPMVVVIKTGKIVIKKDGTTKEAFTDSGFMQVYADHAVILVDDAEWPEEIDENRANAAKTRAEERLMRQISKIEYIKSQTALARAMARLRVKRGSI